jgi:hypothetical protein
VCVYAIYVRVVTLCVCELYMCVYCVCVMTMCVFMLYMCVL